MPKYSKYREQDNWLLKKRAFGLYKTGLSLRQVAEKFDMSHEWVRSAVTEFEKELNEPVDPSTHPQI